MDENICRLIDELRAQGLVESPHLLKRLESMPEGQIYPQWASTQLFWSIVSLETRIAQLELEAGIENVTERMVPNPAVLDDVIQRGLDSNE